MTDEPRRRRIETVPEAPHSISSRRDSAVGFAIGSGAQAPAFALPSESGVVTSLASFRGRRVLLCFAPTNVASVLLAELAAHRETLSAVTPLIVVRGNREDASTIAGAYGVTVLADADGAVHRAYDVLDPLLGRVRLAVFLVDAEGNVASVWSQPDPTRCVPLALAALDPARRGS